MLKKIGLSAAAILAVVALAKPPAAMAADRDDFRHGYREHGDRDRGDRYIERRNVPEYREARDHRDYRERNDYRQREWRAYERRVREDRDCYWR